MWWVYHPRWTGEDAPEPINARVEKVVTSKYFRGAFAQHRCLEPASGWYEWVPIDGQKQSYFLTREDREPFWFAGICSERPVGEPVCAIITEPARGAAKAIHDRMPLALDSESQEPWLDPHLTVRETMRPVTHHLDNRKIPHWRVSTRVNTTTHDDESLIAPLTGS